jgi:hypothetical protein
MSMIEDMTKEKQALSDEHQKQMDQTKGVSTHVPTDNKFEIYQQYVFCLYMIYVFITITG